MGACQLNFEIHTSKMLLEDVGRFGGRESCKAAKHACPFTLERSSTLGFRDQVWSCKQFSSIRLLGLELSFSLQQRCIGQLSPAEKESQLTRIQIPAAWLQKQVAATAWNIQMFVQNSSRRCRVGVLSIRGRLTRKLAKLRWRILKFSFLTFQVLGLLRRPLW